MITNSSFIISSTDVSKCPVCDLPEYAFIGRSNVGKSSLINCLCHHSQLAKTSQKPGKTLLINHFLIVSNGQKWHLVDLPGYGFAQTGQSQRIKLRTMIERYCLYREQLTNLFVLIDSRHEPQKNDLDFIQWLGENGIPFAIVFTKSDKVSRNQLQANISLYRNTLSETWEELPPMFITSATKNTGTEELLAYIEQINTSLKP